MSDPNPNPQDQGIRSIREQLEAEQAARRELEAQLAAGATVAKENAFLKAGVNLESPLGQLLFNGYQGEIDVEKIREQAVAVGAIGSTPPPAPPPDDRQQIITDLSDGSLPPLDPNQQAPTDPWEEGYAAFHERRRRGDTTERAAAEVFDRVITAAVEGDERVLYDPERWRDEFNSRPVRFGQVVDQSR